jgi:hypothetical protein
MRNSSAKGVSAEHKDLCCRVDGLGALGAPCLGSRPTEGLRCFTYSGWRHWGETELRGGSPQNFQSSVDCQVFALVAFRIGFLRS